MVLNTKNHSKDEILHILWFNWYLDQSPKLSILYKKTNSSEMLTAHITKGDELDFILTGEKICVGYPDINDLIVPCAQSRKITKGIQCWECLRSDPLLGCARCKGIECVNPKAWTYCINTPHIVYLAGFHKGLVKVGTAKKSRLERRLLEQGASVACIIARAPTQIRAKYIEHRIAKEFDIPETVSEKIKIESLISSDIGVQKNTIEHLRKRICQNLQMPDIVSNEPVQEYYTTNFDKPITLVDIGRETSVKGTVVFAKGRHVIIENAGTNKVVDLFKLRGSLIRIGAKTSSSKNLLDSWTDK